MADLPAIFNGARRGRTLHEDGESAITAGWDLDSGRPLRLRILQPEWSQDRHARLIMVQAAAMAKGQGILHPKLGAGWPHLRLDLPGPPLADLLPTDEPMDSLLTTRALCGALLGICALGGRAPAGELGDWLFFEGEQLILGHLGQLRSDGLAALGELALALDPAGDDSACLLVATWVDSPPPDLAGAVAVLVRCLHDDRVRAARALQAASERRGTQDRLGRLTAAVVALSASLAPPRFQGSLPTPGGGPDLPLKSDGHSLWAGPATLWSPSAGLAVGPSRLVLRAWSQAGRPSEPAPLMRWLRAMSRLRSARLLLLASAQSENWTVSR